MEISLWKFSYYSVIDGGLYVTAIGSRESLRGVEEGVVLEVTCGASLLWVLQIVGVVELKNEGDVLIQGVETSVASGGDSGSMVRANRLLQEFDGLIDLEKKQFLKMLDER